jgi:hypothetical protein
MTPRQRRLDPEPDEPGAREDREQPAATDLQQ